MSDKEDEQSFEELFDEMAGDVPPAPVEMSIPDEGDADVQLRETQEEEKEEGQGQGQGLESEPEPEPEPEEPSDPNEIIESLRQENRDLTHRYNSDLGRQNAHQRKIKDQEQIIAQLQKQISESQPAATNPLQEDYPDIAEGAEKIISSKLDPVNEKVARMESALERFELKEQEQHIQGQYQALAQVHPDFEEIAVSPEFNHWISRQPPFVRDKLESEDATEAAWLLAAYKNEVVSVQQGSNSGLKQRREKQLRQGQNVPSRGGRSQQIQPPESDFDAAFDYFVEQDERR